MTDEKSNLEKAISAWHVVRDARTALIRASNEFQDAFGALTTEERSRYYDLTRLTS